MDKNISNTSNYETYIKNADSQMTYYFVVISSAIGIPGNLISMFVFIRLTLRNKKINMGFLYTFQTIIDLIMLILTLLVFRGSPYLFGYLVLNIGDSHCRAFMFLRRFIIQASSWISVLIIFDRFTFVLYKSRFRFMKNKFILSLIILVLMILIAIVNIANLFYYIGGSSTTSIFTCIASSFVAILSDMVSMVVRIHIPLLLMLIFDIRMIYHLYKSSKSAKASSVKRKEHQFTIAAMLCTFLFFITYFPLAIFYIFYDIELYSGAFNGDSVLSVLYTFYLNIFLNISYVQQTFSLFIYLAFNKLFRRELFKILFFKSVKKTNLENSKNVDLNNRHQ